MNRYYSSLEEENEVMELFSQSREAVKSIVEEYKACKELNYLDDEDDDDGDFGISGGADNDAITQDQDMDI